MTLYGRGANPIWLLDDLVGNLFDDTFYMYVLENTIPYMPAPVYHTPNGIPWTNPIQFLANGTLPVDIFFDPDLVYRLEFRQNDGILPPSQSDPLIYEVSDYIAGAGGNTPIDTVAFTSSNQITNPQFSLINFKSPYTLAATDPDPIEIAPGWFLELAGTGTVTLTQVPLNDDNANPSNAPYALQLTLVGWIEDSIFLRQRFEQNGMLWADKTVSSTITARVEGAAISLSANLIDSNGSAPVNVLTVPAVNGSWNEYTGHGTLPETTNPDLPPAAYLDYKLSIPNNVDLYVTSFQLVVQNKNDLSEPEYEQDTIERQVDHTFHYYKQKLAFKPIPSMLTGWDFPLNPAQFGSTGNLGAPASAAYVWDQTIGQRGAGATVAYERNAITGGIQFTTGGSDPESFFILQYLSGAQAKKILGTRLSVNVFGYLTAAGEPIICRVYLLRGSSAAVIPVLGDTIGATNTAGEFIKNDTPGQGENWTYILRDGLSDETGVAWDYLNAVLSNEEINNPANDLSFSGWEITDPTEIDDTDKFAIVVTFALDSVPCVITINSISLVQGDIPTRPAAQTVDEVLRECQYYYETTFQIGATVPSAVTLGQLSAPMIATLIAANTVEAYPNAFGCNWASLKCTNPTVTFYSGVSTTANKVELFLNTTAGGVVPGEKTLGTFWTSVSATTKSFRVIPAVTGGTFASDASLGNNNYCTAWIQYHYTSDARLGIV